MTDIVQLKMKPVTVDLVGKWIKLSQKREDWTEAAIEIVCLFYGISVRQANLLTLESIVEAASKAIHRMTEIKADAILVGEVDIKGRRFRFNKDLNEIAFAKVVDIKKLGKDILERPGYLLAVLYDEVGDPTMNRQQKEQLFLTDFPAEEFLALSSFFLRVSLLSKHISFLQKEGRTGSEIREMMRSQTGTSGRTRSTFWHRILTATLTKSQRCAIQRYSSGKSFLGRGAGWLRWRLNQKK